MNFVVVLLPVKVLHLKFWTRYLSSCASGIKLGCSPLMCENMGMSLQKLVYYGCAGAAVLFLTAFSHKLRPCTVLFTHMPCDTSIYAEMIIKL